jgi:hypothetical protein
VLDTKGAVVRKDPLPPGTTSTYVTIQSDNLPLTRPLRLIPGGDIVADALDPTLTQLVNAGYQDRQPIPTDPTETRPMTPGSSLSNLGGVPGSVPKGVDAGVTTAGKDLSDPTKLVINPLGEAGKLPFVSTLVPASLTNSAVSTQKVNTTAGSGNPLLSGLNKGGSPSSASGSTGGANPVKDFTDKIKDAVNNATGGLSKAGTG